MKLSLRWLKGVPKEREQEMREKIVLAKPAMLRLTEILDTSIKETDNARRKRSAYFMPAWSEYQADCNGYIRALQEVQHLINSDQR